MLTKEKDKTKAREKMKQIAAKLAAVPVPLDGIAGHVAADLEKVRMEDSDIVVPETPVPLTADEKMHIEGLAKDGALAFSIEICIAYDNGTFDFNPFVFDTDEDLKKAQAGAQAKVKAKVETTDLWPNWALQSTCRTDYALRAVQTNMLLKHAAGRGVFDAMIDYYASIKESIPG